MKPITQRRNASVQPKQSFNELPEGWTRKKVAIAYDTAPRKGVPKSQFIEKWNKKYDFQLTGRKARDWVSKFLKKEHTQSEEDSDFFESN